MIKHNTVLKEASMKRLIATALLLLLISSCAPSTTVVNTEATIKAAVEATLAAKTIEKTPLLNSSTTPQATNRPTSIGTPSITPENTPTSAPTNTPLPTATPAPTFTPTATNTPFSKDAYIDSANPKLDYKEVDKSDSHIGEIVCWKGKIFKIEESNNATFFQAWYFEGAHNSYSNDAFAVIYPGTLPGIYEDTEVLVCGEVGRKFEGTNAYGASISQPQIIPKIVEIWKPASNTNKPAATPIPPMPLPKTSALGIEQKIAIWSVKLTDVKRAKAVYFFSEATIAKGTYLIPILEFRNDGSGTASPRHNITFYLRDEQGRTFEYGTYNDAVLGAAWQFNMGHLYDDINPGLVLGITIPFDVPGDMGDVWLLAKEDPSFACYLGNVSQLQETK
jgi:hypothetical protein